jgi:hypothetical protein
MTKFVTGAAKAVINAYLADVIAISETMTEAEPIVAFEKVGDFQLTNAIDMALERRKSFNDIDRTTYRMLAEIVALYDSSHLDETCQAVWELLLDITK